MKLVMLEMDCCDTSADALTMSANKNRVASKKLFEQLQQSSRLPIAHLNDGQMLHRTPSGAQKRIRQRQEQKWLKAVAATSNSNNSEVNGYRSLIDSGAYKSILPDELPSSVKSFQMNQPPAPRIATVEQTSPVSKISTSVISEVTAGTTPITNPVINTAIAGGKPTVQVHPMPSSTASNLNSTASSLDSKDSGIELVIEKNREKPAVPKKPSKLILSSAQNEVGSFTALNLSTSCSNLFIPSAQVSPSTSSFRLYSTPSLICLHNAFMQSSLSDEEIEQLNARREKLIESISRKVKILDEERAALEDEIISNEALRKEIIDELSEDGDWALLEKLENNLTQNAQLCRLETRLRMQLERLESLCTSGTGDEFEKEWYCVRIERLKRQLSDQVVLRRAFDRRDSETDKLILAVISDERASQWRIYKETWKRLAIEKQEIDERLMLGHEQLKSLEKVQPIV